MERERAPHHQLTPDQVRALGRPLRGEILSAFQNFGPTSVTEVATRLGQPPKSLYYQVRKMVEVGLLRAVGSRGEGTRAEAVYDVVANAFFLDQSRTDPEYRGRVTASVEQTLRTAAREFGEANQPGASELPFIVRKTVSLTPEEVKEVHELLHKAVRLMESKHDPAKSHRVSLTAVVSPLPSRGE